MNRLFFLSLFLGILSVELRGELTLHPLIGNHAVFQRDVPFPVIGKADSGAEVVVQWRGKDYQAKAGADGKWSLQLDPSPATEKGQVLKVKSGTNSIEVSDILIGEVWLASGQSNMEWPLNKCGAQMAEAESAEDPHLRLAWVSRATAPLPAESVKTSWRSATKSTALTFSAVGYFFGRELRKTTQVPVGVIQSAVGGTPAEAWTPIEFLEAESDFAKAVNSRKEYPN